MSLFKEALKIIIFKHHYSSHIFLLRYVGPFVDLHAIGRSTPSPFNSFKFCTSTAYTPVLLSSQCIAKGLEKLGVLNNGAIH